MENEVQQALAVMDKETGKLLTYCQLMRHTKYKKVWGTSAAKKIGQLTQGVGGQIKGTTHNIVHPSTQGPPKQNEGRNIWTVCM